MYNNLHGVFELIEDAIDAAYEAQHILEAQYTTCLLYTSPSPRD